MRQSRLTLTGNFVQLQPLGLHHAEGLVEAAAADPLLYKWTYIPGDMQSATEYVKTAISWRDDGTAEPFATVRMADSTVIGSTRFWNIEHWTWPAGHPRHGRSKPDACEIGWTWLSASAVRTPINTEAKLLMLTHAFETWGGLRVCFHTDARNERSRAAIERIGGRFEGVLRAHRLAADVTPRDSARYSIVAEEWPVVKVKLLSKLNPLK